MISLGVGPVWTEVSAETYLELAFVRDHLSFKIDLRSDEYACVVRDDRFHSGLVGLVIGILEENGVRFSVEALQGLVPRGGVVGLDGLPCLPIESVEIGVDFLSGVNLRDYQIESARKLIHRVRAYGKAPTGSGKTEIAFTAAKWLIDNGHADRALFLAGSTHILDQTYARLCDRGFRPCRLWRDSMDGANVLLSSVQMAYSKIRSGDRTLSSAGIGVVIGDEIHHLPADSWTSVFEAVDATFRFGLSATPLTNLDGPLTVRDYSLIGLTGPLAFDIPERILIRSGDVAKPVVCMVGCGTDKFWTSEWSSANEQGVVDCVPLNSELAKIAFSAYGTGLKVLMLVQQVKHGLILMEILRRSYGYESNLFVGGKQVHSWVGGRIKQLPGGLEKVSRIFDSSDPCIVIGTSVLGEGVDLPTANLLVNCFSSRSYRLAVQGPGRVLRAKGGRAFIIDIDHTCHPYLSAQSRARREVYEGIGYPVVRGVDPVFAAAQSQNI
jgi:hypothetical protein